MNRNRITTDPTFKPPSIASISSNVALMATNKDRDLHSPSTPTADVQSLLDSFKANSNRDSKRVRTVCPPKGTKPYTITNSDTLEKIALQHNLTPSELLQLNKLNSRIVFPGQIVYVPEASYSSSNNDSPSIPSLLLTPTTKSKDEDALLLLADRRLSSGSPSPPTIQQDVGAMLWSMTRQTAAKPGRAERLKSEASTESESSTSRTIEDRVKTYKEDNTKLAKQIQRSLSNEENKRIDEECLQRFIKLNVRLMTEDHKSVAGTLLVTPNAVMFDPDIRDVLVKTHGVDKYGLIIRMDLLAGIALYEDIAMYEHEATARDEEKRKMCHSISIKSPQQSPSIVPNNDQEEIRELVSSLLDQIDKESNPSFVLFNAAANNRRRTISDTNDDLFYSSDDARHSSGILVDDKDIPSQGYQLENYIQSDQFSKRFGEIDKVLKNQHEIYATLHPVEIPYYLCIKISTLSSNIVVNQERQNRRHIDNIYGKKDLDHEYWFAVPKEKIDHLYTFFLRWNPERASDPSSSNTLPSPISQFQSGESPSAKGFVLLANDDPELSDDHIPRKNQNTNSSKGRSTTISPDSGAGSKKQHYLKRQNTLLKEWEIISVDEIYRRINVTHANPTQTFDLDILPPQLLQPSTLIDEEQSKQILLELPARVHGLNWQLVFSTDKNGFSLSQLYRRSMQVEQDTPALILVKDLERNIFGAYISQQLMISEGFYGTGESFLYTFHPTFKVFHWTGHNQFFVKGDTKSLGIGSGEGTYGLWFDADLYHGRTCPSKTFDNVRLSTKEDFIIASVEVWTFLD